jgi:hypothetical protein
LLLTDAGSVGSLKYHFKALLLKKMKLQAKDFGFLFGFIFHRKALIP